jgi:two-component system chemotaxis response regulator CheB
LNCSIESGEAAGTKTRVLIVDDSALIRSLLTKIIASQSDLTVVGAAAHPLAAREMIRATNPDVLTLDIEMPQMDGLVFLEKLMRLRPMPVLMVSTLTERGSEATLRALELGAIDFIAKPKLDIARGLQDYADEINAKIRAIAKVRQHRPAAVRATQCALLPNLGNREVSTEKLVFVGASTGGTEAIRAFLTALPSDCPAVLITQHMPAGFTRTFAARLDGLCRVSVKEAQHGERVLPGHVYIAPGDRHLRLGRSGSNYTALLDESPPVNRHRPSVEVLFRSAAEVAGRNAVAVMLTGMGKDGAIAMLDMKRAGAFTLAQDEATCVVFGMPKEAIAAGAVDEVLPLTAIAPRILSHLSGAASGRIRI